MNEFSVKAFKKYSLVEDQFIATTYREFLHSLISTTVVSLPSDLTMANVDSSEHTNSLNKSVDGDGTGHFRKLTGTFPENNYSVGNAEYLYIFIQIY